MQSPFLVLLPGYLDMRVKIAEVILALEDRVYMMRMAMKDRRLGPDDTNIGAAFPTFFICERKRLLSHYFFYLEYNHFTMLYCFLLYNIVNQPCVYIYPLPLEPPSTLSHLEGHHRALS